MKEFIEYIVKNIVENPDKVVVTENSNDNSSEGAYNSMIYYIEVDENDIGILIGKKGKTIKSIRNLIKLKAIKEGKYVDVRIKEPEENL